MYINKKNCYILFDFIQAFFPVPSPFLRMSLGPGRGDDDVARALRNKIVFCVIHMIVTNIIIIALRATDTALFSASQKKPRTSGFHYNPLRLASLSHLRFPAL
jgi:hypothetical protein